MSSVQVGAFCYADLMAAGAAACAAQVPSVTVSGANVVALSCSGVSSAGGLLMMTSIAPADGSASAVSRTVETTPAFAPCVQSDVMNAGITVGVAIASALVLPWGYLKICKLLRWGRGEQT